MYNIIENMQERSSLLIQDIFLWFLKAIRPALGLKAKQKVYYYFQLVGRNKIRSPAFVVDYFDKSLRVCVTYKCNVSCEFCYAKGLLKEFPMDMNLDDFLSLSKWAIAQGWKNMYFLGGEPTIHPQFEEIMDVCLEKQVSVFLSTNGFFDEDLLERFKSSPVRNIAFSYPQNKVPMAFKSKFLYNLRCLRRQRIPLALTGVLDGKTDQWKEIVDTAVKFKLPIRWSIVLPGYTRNVSDSSVFSNLNFIGSQLFEALKTCVNKKVVCFVYRPIPVCMFTPEQWRHIRKIFRYLVYTRCPLGFEGNFSSGVTVNPDLSTFACISFFIKGPLITSFKDRTSLSQYYEKASKEIMATPSMKKCKTCQLYQNFLSSIKPKANQPVKRRICDKDICQGGCFAFRDACSALQSI